MTTDQATHLMAYLLACYPNVAASEATLTIYLQHLEPLPYDRTEAAIKRLVLTRVYPTLPTIAEVVQAAGVDDDASRTQLLLAVAGRCALVRDAASSTGWAVGRALLPPAALPPPAPSGPTGPLVSAERQKSLRERVLTLGSGLRGERWGDGAW